MVTVRPASRQDSALILKFIHGLAEYERAAPGVVVVTEADILRDGFPESGEPKFRVLIAELDGSPAGFALYFFNYSTWLGRWGLYLEDLFVPPELRGKGVGKALLRALARVALEKQCYGMRWVVLDWNQPAIDFYKGLGAEMQREWLPVLMMGEPLRKLAEAE